MEAEGARQRTHTSDGNEKSGRTEPEYSQHAKHRDLDLRAARVRVVQREVQAEPTKGRGRVSGEDSGKWEG